MKKILIAEDEAAIREFVVINLKRNGYEVAEAADGVQAIRLYDAQGGDFDVAILDIMMPEVDGLEVCRYLRTHSDTIGIILLTAKGQEQDKVGGFLSGADDYVVKPFSPSELIARVDAVYRRVSLNREMANAGRKAAETIESGDFTLHMRSRKICYDDREVELTQIEFQIMEFFMTNPGKSLSRRDILEHVWGANYVGDDKVIDVNVRRLRMKLEADPGEPKHLTTVWGFGYKWVP